ncbi:hypothetical protein M0804_014166 [Polistes exclamans]|nr:hypothetical protein M0804_014169 [Polistes exclamans]KAI4475656.1 hypothetical protein M0804_014166 [Polistes exclamans]
MGFHSFSHKPYITRSDGDGYGDGGGSGGGQEGQDLGCFRCCVNEHETGNEGESKGMRRKREHFDTRNKYEEKEVYDGGGSGQGEEGEKGVSCGVAKPRSFSLRGVIVVVVVVVVVSNDFSWRGGTIPEVKSEWRNQTFTQWKVRLLSVRYQEKWSHCCS